MQSNPHYLPCVDDLKKLELHQILHCKTRTQHETLIYNGSNTNEPTDSPPQKRGEGGYFDWANFHQYLNIDTFLLIQNIVAISYETISNCIYIQYIITAWGSHVARLFSSLKNILHGFIGSVQS